MTSKEERTDTNEENRESRPKISGSRKPGGRKKKNPKESSKRECKKEKENEKAHERRKTK